MNENLRIGDFIPGRWTHNKKRWQIKDVIPGGLGQIYIVYDHEDHEILAAKSFDDDVLKTQPELSETFLQEIQIWLDLDIHENVTRAYYAVKDHFDRNYLFLEYVSGGDLSRLVGKPYLTQNLTRIIRLAIQFCDGISFAFQKGLQAHRDIKPQNCLLTRDGILKVTDFGLAKTTVSSKRSGGISGTPAYMPPEQWMDFNAADVRSDIYSFGVVLYELVAGVRPFQGTLQELAVHHQQQVPDTRVIGPELREVIEQCLAKDPAHRFQNFLGLRSRLGLIYEQVAGEPAPTAATGPQLNVLQLNSKGVSLEEVGRAEEAINLCFDPALSLDPSLALTWYNKGVALRTLGDSPGAMIHFQRAVNLDPNNASAWYNIGHLFWTDKKNQEAIYHYNKAIELDPYYAHAWYNKGMALWDSGDPRVKRDKAKLTEALVCFSRAVELDPDDWEAWSMKGWAHGELDDPQKEIDCYDRAIAINPRDTVSIRNKSITLKSLGRFAEALVCCEQLLSIDPTDLTTVARARQLRTELAKEHSDEVLPESSIKEDQIAWLSLKNGLKAWERRDAIAALTHYDIALRADPHFSSAWYERGIALHALKRHKDAVASFDKVISGNSPLPLVAMAWNEKGVNLAAEGRNEDALTCYEKAVELSPNSDIAWFNRGQTSVLVGKYEEALSHLVRCLELNPGMIQALKVRGGVLLILKRYYEALECFVQAKDSGMTDHNLVSLGQQAGNAAGGQFYDARHYDEAIECFNHTISFDPHSKRAGNAWRYRGLCLSSQGQDEKAVESFQNACQIDLESAERWLELGTALARVERSEEALICLDRAILIDPNCGDAFKNKGILLMLSGEDKESFLCFREAQRLGADMPDFWKRLQGKH